MNDLNQLPVAMELGEGQQNATSKMSNTKKSFKHRQGKSARGRATDKYRMRTNKQEADKHIRELNVKFGLLEADDSGSLAKVISDVELTVQRRAIPLSVTTRGVGIAMSIIYDRAATTWSRAAIADICTIYQAYRVCLYLFHLKVYKAQQVQSEPLSQSPPFERIYLEDRIREVIQSVSEIPSVVMNVLDCVGKYKGEGGIYHCGYYIPQATDSDYVSSLSLCLNPDNIRATLVAVNAAPVATRDDFLAHCTIPGVIIEDGLVSNIDQIWPADAGEQLATDVHDFKDLITRVQSRLPHHSFPKITWSGMCTGGILWSTERLDVKLTSAFFTEVQSTGPKRSKRTASGSKILAEDKEVSRYKGSSIKDWRGQFWSRESSPHDAIVLGTASLVGEVCGLGTRFEMNNGFSVTASPIQAIYNISDAPR